MEETILKCNWRSVPLWACLAVLGIAAPAVAADPVKIRTGWILTPASILPLMPEKPDLQKHHGKSYVLEPLRFQASPLQMTALASNDIEIATLGYSSFSIAVLNAGLRDLRIIADEIQDGTRGHFSFQFVVRKDSPIQKVADLKGKRVAVNGIGSGVDMSLQAMMRKNGLAFKRDYTTLEVGFPNMKAMLLENKSDLVTAVVPFSEDPELKSISRVLFDSRDAMGSVELSFLVVRAPFLSKNRAALVDFLEDYVRFTRWVLDPANRAEMLQIVSRVTKLPIKAYEGWVYTKADFYRDPDALVDLNALQNNIRTQKELGFIKEDLEVPKFAELDLVKEAARRLK